MSEEEFWDLDFRRLSALARGRAIDQGADEEQDVRPATLQDLLSWR